MDGQVRLGRIAGFPLAMDWSVLAIVALITWSTSTVVLPDLTPGYRTEEYWAAGVLAALLFFASLLAHEVAHAVLARRAGVEVTGLTLWVFGGVATLSGEPRSPRDDFQIAGVGPLVSLGLGVGFVASAVALGMLGMAPLLLGVTNWLAVVNLMLGVFNLIPGAPLDGGRLLRAWLWRRHGDRTRAALSAARAGERTGLVLIGVGLLELLSGASAGGLWMAVIGWFIFNAAKAEGSFTVTMTALSGVRCADVMTPDPVTLPDWLTTGELLERWLPLRTHQAYPTVGADGRLTGLLVLASLRGLRPEAGATTRLEEVAVPVRDVTTAAPDELLTVVVTRMSEKSAGRVVVVEGGCPVGIVTARDLDATVRRRSVAGPQPPAPVQDHRREAGGAR